MNMKDNNASARRELDNLKKGISDFIAKYSNMLKKYRVDFLVSFRKVGEKRKDKDTISVIDIEKRRNEIHSMIGTIEKNITVLHEYPKINTLTKVEINQIDVIRTGVKLIKRELPDLLSKRNFSFSKEHERIATKECGTTIRKNLFLITQLKEEEITLLFSFLHSLYKELPSIIKGKGGAENGNKKKGECDTDSSNEGKD